MTGILIMRNAKKILACNVQKYLLDRMRKPGSTSRVFSGLGTSVYRKSSYITQIHVNVLYHFQVVQTFSKHPSVIRERTLSNLAD